MKARLLAHIIDVHRKTGFFVFSVGAAEDRVPKIKGSMLGRRERRFGQRDKNSRNRSLERPEFGRSGSEEAGT
ncbi:hypothetical protein D7X48_12135 [bacterium D16-50]|nr:hypothetical protein D7X48_12135 [bacterium D16-50]